VSSPIVSQTVSTQTVTQIPFTVQVNYLTLDIEPVSGVDGCAAVPGWLTVSLPGSQSSYAGGSLINLTLSVDPTQQGTVVFDSLLPVTTATGCFGLTASNTKVIYSTSVSLSLGFYTPCAAGSMSATGSNVPSPCLLCAAGGYEQVSYNDHLTCQNLPCAERFYCGPGAVEDQTYRQMIDFQSIDTTVIVGSTRQIPFTISNIDNEFPITVFTDVNLTWVSGVFQSDGTTRLNSAHAITIPAMSNVSLLLGVDTTKFDISSISSDTSSFSSAFPMSWTSPNEPSGANYSFPISINVTLAIVTILVTPSTFYYPVTSGQVYNISTSGFSPAPQVSIFNNLCQNAISYTIEPGCSEAEAAAGVPDWFAFDSPIYVLEEIPPQQGLPDTINFHLDFTGAVNDRLVSQSTVAAPTLTFCFQYKVNLIGLGINVTASVNISVLPTVPCPAGYYSPSGFNTDGCLPCSVGTYQSALQQTTCISCPQDAPGTLGNASTRALDCVAAAGSYFSSPNSSSQTTCPVQAFCNGTGTTLETLYLKPGYWRTYSGSSQFIQCPQPQFCAGGFAPPAPINFLAPGGRRLQGNDAGNSTSPANSTLCVLFSTGVLCQQCADGYVHRGDQRFCQACTSEDTESDRLRIAGIMIGLSFAFVAIVTWVAVRLFFSHTKPADGRPNVIRQLSTKIDLAMTVVDGGTKLKIIVGLIQVVSGMTLAFSQVLPASFLQMTAIFSVLALDLIALFDFGCALPDQSHYISLLMTTMLPILVLFCIGWFFDTGVFFGEVQVDRHTNPTPAPPKKRLVLLPVYVCVVEGRR